MGTFTEPLQDPVAGRPGDKMIGRSKDVRGTSVKHAFKFNSQTRKRYFDMLLETF